MSGLPVDLQKLPPTALDVLRYLGTSENGASSDAIIDGAGLSVRGFGKAIRRLVTRHYVDMPVQGYYTLTESGSNAAKILRDLDGGSAAPAPAVEAAPASVPDSIPATTPPAAATPSAAPQPAPAPKPAPDTSATHPRRVSIFVPRALVAQFTARLRFGFDRPAPDAPAFERTARTVVRMSAPGCDIDVAEYAIDVPAKGPAGPVDFRITPHQPGSVRVQIEVFQLVEDWPVAVGGMFFDLPVAEFPTPDSAEFQTLATTLHMQPGQPH